MKNKALKYLFICLIFLSSCINHKNKTEQIKEVEIINVLNRKNIVTLLKTKNDNSNLKVQDLSNIDKINGFRNLKLGLELDSLDFSGFLVDSSFSQYNVIRLLDKNIIMEDIKIGVHRIRFVQLVFFKNKLKEIKIEYGQNSFDALSMLNNIYGKPTNYNTLKKKIQKKLEIVNKQNSNITSNTTDTFLKGLLSIKNEDDIVLDNTEYKWETQKTKVTYVLKKDLNITEINSFNPKKYHYSNLLTISTAGFHNFFIELQKEIKEKKEKDRINEYNRITKKKLNDF